MRALPLLATLTLGLAVAPCAFAGAPGDAPMVTQPAKPVIPPAALSDDPESRYQALLAVAKDSAPNADWGALRLAYAERPGARTFAQSEARRRMSAAMAVGDCAAALGDARSVMDDDYVDPDAHFVAAYCEEKAGDTRASQLDRDVGAGLIASIETGDGLSLASAFTVINAEEEASVLRALGVSETGRSRIAQDGHAYDAVATLDAKGEARTYYFEADRLVTMPPMLKPGDVSEGGPPDRSP